MKKNKTITQTKGQKEAEPKIPESVMKAAKQDLKNFEGQSREAFLQRLEMERKLDL